MKWCDWRRIRISRFDVIASTMTTITSTWARRLLGIRIETVCRAARERRTPHPRARSIHWCARLPGHSLCYSRTPFTPIHCARLPTATRCRLCTALPRVTLINDDDYSARDSHKWTPRAKSMQAAHKPFDSDSRTLHSLHVNRFLNESDNFRCVSGGQQYNVARICILQYGSPMDNSLVPSRNFRRLAEAKESCERRDRIPRHTSPNTWIYGISALWKWLMNHLRQQDVFLRF